MSQPFKLFRLQQLDTQIDTSRARLKEIEALINDDHELRKSMEEAESAQQALHDAKKEVQKADDETAQLRLKIEQTDASLYGGKIRNPKELQDLQNELAALKRHMVVLEDRQLESMYGEEQATELSEAAANALQQQRDRRETKLALLRAEQKRLENDLVHLEEERVVGVGSIEGVDYQLYEQLRRDRRGVAVARVSDRACSACGTTLNAMLLQAARSQNEVHRCDTCGRILYVG
jgi:hypothetical protein